LREVKAPTLLRKTANRWRQGCQPYAPAAVYPQAFIIIINNKKIIPTGFFIFNDSWYSFLLEAESIPGP
jgi:hypothetical protein